MPSRTGRSYSFVIHLVLGCVAGFMIALPLVAQERSTPSGTLRGIVRTAAGTPIAGAKVTVLFAETHQKRQEAFTDATGHFALRVPAQGPYTFAVQLPGRTPTIAFAADTGRAPVVITVSDQNTLTVTTGPQQPTPVAPNANTSTTANGAEATGGEKLSSQSVSELPLNGRDFSTLLLLAAGTMTDVNGATNFTNMGLPANTIEGSGFGVISKTAGTSREIQFSLKLIY